MHHAIFLIIRSVIEHLGEATLADVDLDGSGVDPAKGNGLVVSQDVHGLLGNVETGGGVVNGEDVDSVAPVGELPAGTALRRDPC